MGFESFCQIFSYEFGDIVIMFNSFFFFKCSRTKWIKKDFKKMSICGK